MSIYAFKVFDEVVTSGSFARAAENLNLSASAVSHNIRALEDDFGFSLFVRNRAGAALTEEGKKLLPYIRALIVARDNVDQQVSMINNHNVGTVRIAMYSSVAYNWFVKILINFRKKYPGIDVVLSQGNYAKIMEWLDNKEVDMAFTTDALAEGTNFKPLKKDPIICVTDTEYLPKNKFSVTVSDLKNASLIINRECAAYDAKDFIAKHQLDFDTYYDTVEHQTLFAMVREGMGLCLCPELVASDAPGDVKKYSILGSPSRVIGLTYADPAAISPAAKLLTEEIEAYVKSI